MRLFIPTLLVLVSSSSAFAVTRGGGTANPPAGNAANSSSGPKACVAVNPAGKSKAWGLEKCLDADGDETTRAEFEGVSWHADANGGHYGCGPTEADHANNAWDSLTGACETAAKAKADSKIATKGYVDGKYAADHAMVAAMSNALGMTETESTDGAGVVTKVIASKVLADQQAINTATEARLTAGEGRFTAIEAGNVVRDTNIATATTTANNALEEAKKKVSKEAYDVDQQNVADALVALGDRQTATEGKVETLWNGTHFVGFIAPAYVYLDGGTEVTVNEDSDLFAGETLAYGERGAFGVSGGIGGEWQWGGIMATGSVGVIGEHGNQVGEVGVVAYYPYHASETVQIDFGLQGSYLEAGDRLFNTTYAGSTSKLSGFGVGPSLAIGVGKLDLRGTMLIGGVNQQLTVAIDDSGDSVLEDQDANAFVVSIGGRFGGAPR